MVDSAAFIMRDVRELKPGDSIWVNGQTYEIKSVEPGKSKDNLTIRLRGASPQYVAWDAQVRATK